MTSYPPPTSGGSLFNTNDYTRVTSSLTLAEADLRYLRNNSTISLSNLNLSGTLTATSLSGTLTTAAQPNITSFGTLTSISCSGNISGTLTTAAQPNITSLGTLTSITCSGNISGTLTTASQANITTLGNLTALSVLGGTTSYLSDTSGNTINTSLTVGHRLTSGNGAVGIGTQIYFQLPNAAGVYVAGGTISSSLTNATNLSHAGVFNFNTVFNGNFVSSMTLSSSGASTSTLAINGTGTISATNLTGTLTTAAQPNITSLGTLTSLTLSGAVSGITTLAMTGALSGATSISATTLTGTLSTAAQPNITSLGTLTSMLNMSGLSTDYMALYTTTGSGRIMFGKASSPNNQAEIGFNYVSSGSATNYISLGLYGGVYQKIFGDGSITMTGTLTVPNVTCAGNISGTLTTAAQPNITSLGTLTGITCSGNISGTLTTAAQPNITSLGTLASVLNVTTTSTFSTFNCVNTSNTGANIALRLGHYLSSGTAGVGIGVGLDFTSQDAAGNQPRGVAQIIAQYTDATANNFASKITFGTVFGGNAHDSLTLTATGNTANTLAVLGTGLLTSTVVTATTLNGTLGTAAQPNITSVGTLTGISCSGNISGTLTTVDQPNITSLGTLTSLILSGTISGVTTLTATTLAGTLSTAAQPNITSVGTLSSLLISGSITNGTGNITLLTTDAVNNNLSNVSCLSHRLSGGNGANGMGAMEFIQLPDSTGALTYVAKRGGIWTSATSGATIGSLVWYGGWAGVNTTSLMSLVPSSNTNLTLSLSGASSTISSANLTGTLTTAAQPNITSLGTLTSLNVSGAVNYAGTSLLVNSSSYPSSGEGVSIRYAAGSGYISASSDFSASPNTRAGLTVRCREFVVDCDSTTIGSGFIGYSYPLEVGYNSQTVTGYAYLNSSGTVATNGGSSTTNFSARFAGRVNVVGEVNVTSDKRYKSEVQDLRLERCIEFVENVKPKTFIKNGEGKKSIGVIAQDIVKIDMMELVGIHNDEFAFDIDDDAALTPPRLSFSVCYDAIAPILIPVIKDLREKLISMQNRLDKLEKDQA